MLYINCSSFPYHIEVKRGSLTYIKRGHAKVPVAGERRSAPACWAEGTLVADVMNFDSKT